MKFELEKFNRNVSDEELIDDLKRVAKELDKEKVTPTEYEELGKFSNSTLENRFGGWHKTLDLAGLQKSRSLKYTNEELFENLENVWVTLGRQPRHSEMRLPLSKIYGSIYRKRFGMWQKALEALVEYINADIEEDQEIEEVEPTPIQEKEIVYKHQTKRDPSERLKVQVLMRDGNKCRLCGVTVTGENIHFDHIKPWSKGGETILENLQVLCAKHNLAKSDLEYPDTTH